MQSFTKLSSLQRTTHSHTFITADVTARGRRSFKDDITGHFGTGTMHAVFQAAGTVFVEKHALNIMQKMLASCSAHVLSTRNAMLPGPVTCLDSKAETRVQPHPVLYGAFESHQTQRTP